jgi:hypothetical protein
VELVTVVWLVVVRQHFVTPVVAVGPEVQALALMQASESHQIFLEAQLCMAQVVRVAATTCLAHLKQPALEQAHDLMR